MALFFGDTSATTRGREIGRDPIIVRPDPTPGPGDPAPSPGDPTPGPSPGDPAPGPGGDDPTVPGGSGKSGIPLSRAVELVQSGRLRTDERLRWQIEYKGRARGEGGGRLRDEVIGDAVRGACPSLETGQGDNALGSGVVHHEFKTDAACVPALAEALEPESLYWDHCRIINSPPLQDAPEPEPTPPEPGPPPEDPGPGPGDPVPGPGPEPTPPDPIDPGPGPGPEPTPPERPRPPRPTPGPEPGPGDFRRQGGARVATVPMGASATPNGELHGPRPTPGPEPGPGPTPGPGDPDPGPGPLPGPGDPTTPGNRFSPGNPSGPGPDVRPSQVFPEDAKANVLYLVTFALLSYLLFKVV